MTREIESADKVLNHAEAPFTAVLGGAKVSDKIGVIENLVSTCDHIIIGGGMAYTFFKATGGSIGNSLVEEDKLDLARELIRKSEEAGCQLHLPADSVIADSFGNDAATKTSASNAIDEGWMGLDIGPKAIEEFDAVLSRSRTILWNGPMGVFEMDNFKTGTVKVAQSIAKATINGAYSLVGGGDSVAAVNRFGFAENISYVSTGGGAMLELLEGKELPGIAAVSA